MRYASGTSVPDPFILLEKGRKRYLLVSSLEYGRVKKALRRDKTRDVVLLDEYLDRKRSSLALVAAAFLKEKKIKKVMMARRSWASHVDTLRKEQIKVELAEGPLYPERAVKSKEELKEILKVRNATVKAMKVCIGIIEESSVNKKDELLFEGKKVTAEILKKVARKVLLEHACEAPEIIVSHGKQTAYPHESGKGIMKAGEPIMMDFFPRSMESGYWFDMTRTVCRGATSPEIKKVYAAVKDAQDAAMKLVKPGVAAKKLHEAAAAVFEKRGFKTTKEKGFLHAVGHGLGLEIHEAPSVGPRSEGKLKAGNVITIEPGYYDKRFGGVRLENTLLVTTTGYKELTRMKRVLRI